MIAAERGGWVIARRSTKKSQGENELGTEQGRIQQGQQVVKEKGGVTELGQSRERRGGSEREVQ